MVLLISVLFETESLNISEQLVVKLLCGTYYVVDESRTLRDEGRIEDVALGQINPSAFLGLVWYTDAYQSWNRVGFGVYSNKP